MVRTLLMYSYYQEAKAKEYQTLFSAKQIKVNKIIANRKKMDIPKAKKKMFSDSKTKRTMSLLERLSEKLEYQSRKSNDMKVC